MGERMELTLDDVRGELELIPLPSDEGGLFQQSYRDAQSSAIYYAIGGEHFSALHRLTAPEIWHFYAGAAVRMLLLHPGGEVTNPVLGTDLREGQRPQVIVPAWTWQGALSTGAWSLVGTTMAPGYTPEMFELGVAPQLAARYPAAAAKIGEFAAQR
jgi:predicted cupin superfamily sugar epimerase